MPTLNVDPRFCGPTGFANGGYLAGLMAQHTSRRVRIRLEQPIPLNTDMELQLLDDGGLELKLGDALLARAVPVDFKLEAPPSPPSYVEALEASRHFSGFTSHPAPRCFVCGPERARGDGLRVFAGRWSASNLVAAPWVADASLSDGAGKVRPVFISAVLDCPGAFAARDVLVPMVLGEFTAHVDRCPHIEEPCVVVGWRISVSGRKYEVGTALFDEDGEVCARARATWIELRA
jgi:acyl-coenzyme A thioesterase PaaI-like protein